MKYIIPFIILAVYIGLNYYLYTRCIQSLPNSNLRPAIATLFITLTLSFFAGLFLEDIFSVKITTALQTVGGLWLFATLYLIMFAFLFDFLRLANHYFNIFPAFIKNNYQAVKITTAIFSAATVVTVFILGNIKFNNPDVVKIDLKSNKQLVNKTKIVVVSDLHFGYTIGKNHARRFVKLINDQDPDIVLICGDLFDRSLRPVIQNNIASELQKIQAARGKYVILGNHEYYGKLQDEIDYVKQSGLTLLRDSSALPHEGIVIIGRDDRTNHNRKTVKQLVDEVDNNKFIVMMNHQPYNLEEVEENGIDLHLSGHTHDGQIWPANLITRRMYEISHGFLQKGKSAIYVSSGLGIWGPKLRIGTVSELIVFTITPDK